MEAFLAAPPTYYRRVMVMMMNGGEQPASERDYHNVPVDAARFRLKQLARHRLMKSPFWSRCT